MQRILISIVLICGLFGYAWADGVIGPELEKALNNRGGENLRVIITLKKQFSTENIIAQHMVRGETQQVKQQVFDILQAECQINQHFIKSLCERMMRGGHVSNVESFWLANAISLEADASAIQELALQPDVASITLDLEQQMINPLEGDERGEEGLWGLAHIKAREANNKGATGQGVTVAVVDTGLDLDHPAFSNGQVLTELCTSFVDGEAVEDGNGHGTHCAGTVASPTYGVAPDAKIIGVKVLSNSGSGSWTSVMKGVEYAAEKAQVLSMSLGGRASAKGNIVETAVKNAIAAGSTIVIAAGNSGPWGKTISTPGVVQEAITIGAIDSSGKLAYFSSRGPTVYDEQKPDVVAPGVNVLSAWKNGGTNTISGTSMATPHVAGLCALYLSQNPQATCAEIKERLQATAFGRTGVNEYGAGTVDCVASVFGEVAQHRASKKIEFVTDGSGNVTKELELVAPFSVTVTGISVSSAFGNVTAVLNGETLFDGSLPANKKVSVKAKIKSGKNNIRLEGKGCEVKGGTVSATVYFSLWKRADRASKTIEFTTDVSGNVSKSLSLWSPISVTVNGISVTSSFRNVKAVINGKTLFDAPLEGGKKVAVKAKISSGDNNIELTGQGCETKNGTVKATVHFSLWN